MTGILTFVFSGEREIVPHTYPWNLDRDNGSYETELVEKYSISWMIATVRV